MKKGNSDIGSGIHIYVYQTEDGMPFILSVLSDSVKIGKSGEELIEGMNKKDSKGGGNAKRYMPLFTSKDINLRRRNK